LLRSLLTPGPRPGDRTRPTTSNTQYAIRNTQLCAALLIVAVLLLLGYGGQASAGVPGGLPAARKVEQRVLDETAGGGSARFIVLLPGADLSKAYAIKDQDERGWYVYETLRAHAERSQAGVRALLGQNGAAYESYWVANALVVTGDRSLVDGLAARTDVMRIESDHPFKGFDDPVDVASAPLSNDPQLVEWGVQNVNAPQVWAMGFTGQGIVIANQDTGMRWTHNALKPKYRGWNGTTEDHNYNWWDAVRAPVPGHTTNPCGYAVGAPCDDHGHGTHTTGTTSGDDGAGNQVGVAPGARWIGCRNMDAGDGRPSTYMGCFQFFVAPTDLSGNNANPALRPHVMNNSWGCPPSETCAPGTLEASVASAQASGIFVEVSAGNSGSSCGSVSDPPAIYAAAFSTGAFDISNTLAGFSSRGPVTVDGSNRLKPNISAPGVSVRSSTAGTDSSYGNSSGTSMAGPHVVGVVALLWSARPELSRQITETKTLLQNTANPNVNVVPAQTCGGTPSSAIPNNSFGYGRVDALAAVNASAPAPTRTPTATPVVVLTVTTTPTPTAVPTAQMVLRGHVNLQGRMPAPHPSWQVPVTLSLRPSSGGALLQYTATTDLSGYFSINVASGPGGYNWRVKNSHTLANSGGATLASGTTDVEMGTLLEGDASGDNCVDVLDFNALTAAFGSTSGSPNYNPNADFEGNGVVDVLDFNLLKGNFALCGPPELSPSR
jgi:serine protease AprX